MGIKKDTILQWVLRKTLSCSGYSILQWVLRKTLSCSGYSILQWVLTKDTILQWVLRKTLSYSGYSILQWVLRKTLSYSGYSILQWVLRKTLSYSGYSILQWVLRKTLSCSGYSILQWVLTKDTILQWVWSFFLLWCLMRTPFSLPYNVSSLWSIFPRLAWSWTPTMALFDLKRNFRYIDPFRYLWMRDNRIEVCSVWSKYICSWKTYVFLLFVPLAS